MASEFNNTRSNAMIICNFNIKFKKTYIIPVGRANLCYLVPITKTLWSNKVNSKDNLVCSNDDFSNPVYPARIPTESRMCNGSIVSEKKC